MLTCLGVYLLSLLMTLLIPARAGNAELRYGKEAMQFLRDFGTMFRNPRARFSLIGTGSFWLTAAVLRIALIAWLPLNLGITDTDQQSMMIGITAVGVVVSAFLTPKLVPAGKLHRAFYYGLFMVASVMVATMTYELWLTIVLLFLIGIFGGIFVIPLNTMLQEEGKSTIGSGKTIAVQNFSENILTVSGLLIYLTLSQMNVSVNGSVIGIGLVLLAFILFLATQLPKVLGAERRKRTDRDKQVS